MSYNRNILFDINMFKKFYEDHVVNWFNKVVPLSPEQKAFARSNLGISANTVPYSNDNSSLTATNIYGALNELDYKIDGQTRVVNLTNVSHSSGYYNSYYETVENESTICYEPISIGIGGKISKLYIKHSSADNDIPTYVHLLVYQENYDEWYSEESHILNVNNKSIVFNTPIKAGMKLAISCGNNGTPEVKLVTQCISQEVQQVKTCYVSQTSGSDDNDGFTKDAPKATIQAALNTCAAEIVILDTSVYNENLNTNMYIGKKLTIRASADILAGDTKPTITQYYTLGENVLFTRQDNGWVTQQIHEQKIIDAENYFSGYDEDYINSEIIINHEVISPNSNFPFTGATTHYIRLVPDNDLHRSGDINEYISNLSSEYYNKVNNNHQGGWFYFNEGDAQSSNYEKLFIQPPIDIAPSSQIEITLNLYAKQNMLVFYNILEVTIEGINFLYKDLGFNHCGYVNVRNCEFNNCYVGVQSYYTTFCKVEFSNFIASGSGILSTGKGNTLDINNCYIADCCNGISLLANGGWMTCSINNVFIERVSDSSIILTSSDAVLSHVIINDCVDKGIYINSHRAAKNAKLINCEIDNVKASASGVETNGIFVDLPQATSIVVCKNCSVGNTDVGFKSKNNNGIILEDCSIIENVTTNSSKAVIKNTTKII